MRSCLVWGAAILTLESNCPKDLPAFGFWRTVDNEGTYSGLTSGDVVLALIWASSLSFLISNFCCSIWSARSRRSAICLPRFVGAGGSLKGLVRGVSSWLTAVAARSNCSACLTFPTARSKGISHWKPEGRTSGFFDLHPAAERPLESCGTLIKRRWKPLPKIKRPNETWNAEDEAKTLHQEGTRGGINYGIIVKISAHAKLISM